MTRASRYRKKAWEAVVKRDGHICRICGAYAGNKMEAGVAHRIPNTKPNIKAYGYYVIHSRQNQMLTCSLACNEKAIIPMGQDTDDFALVLGMIVKKQGLPISRELERRLK